MKSLYTLLILLSCLITHTQTIVVQTFSYTGATQTFVIPPCAGQMTVHVMGGRGGWTQNGGGPGDGGGVMATMNPTPGTLLYINVGSAGSGSVGGFNGGGNGGAGLSHAGGGGGGASDIRLGGNTLADRIICGGGGGGAGGSSPGASGGNGGSYMSYTCTSPFGVGGEGGWGATSYPPSITGACAGGTATGYADAGGGLTSAGGPTGSGIGGYGQAGSLGQGGGGGDSFGTYGGIASFGNYAAYGGGGGGGGYYGGAGGMGPWYNNFVIFGAGGGGGSTYVNLQYFTVMYLPTGNFGDGIVSFTYTAGGSAVQASASTNTVCAGNPVLLTGMGASSYTWTAPGTGPVYASTIQVAPQASTNYTLTGISSGCMTSTVITIHTDPSILSLTAAPSASVCNGSTVSLNASGASTYSWSGNIQNGSAFTPTATTVYTVNATTAIGCSMSGTIALAVYAPTINISPVTGVCFGSTVILQASGAAPGSYTWANTGANTPSIAVSPISNTIYTVNAFADASNICPVSRTTEVLVYPLPSLTVTASGTFVCAGSPVQLTAGGALTYTWYPASGSATVNGGALQYYPLTSTSFTVAGVGGNNCRNNSTVVLQVDACTGIIASGINIPEIFPSPADQEINLRIREAGDLTIYNINGRKVRSYNTEPGSVLQVGSGDFAPGIYIIEIRTAQSVQRYKILVQHN